MNALSLCLAGLALLACSGGAVALMGNRNSTARLDDLERAVRSGSSSQDARDDLPPEVFALAQRLGARGDVADPFVFFEQAGSMWMTPQGKPTPFTARQTAGVTQSAFVWRAAMGPGSVMRVADSFVDGVGRLEVRALGALTVAKMENTTDVNQGEILRYLAELPWNPDAMLLNKTLTWTVVDGRTIKVAGGADGARGEITFFMDASGLVERMSAPSRMYAKKGGAIPLPWHGRFWQYERMDGRLIPARGEVAWTLEGKEFIYWRGALRNWRRGAAPTSG